MLLRMAQRKARACERLPRTSGRTEPEHSRGLLRRSKAIGVHLFSQLRNCCPAAPSKLRPSSLLKALIQVTEISVGTNPWVRQLLEVRSSIKAVRIH